MLLALSPSVGMPDPAQNGPNIEQRAGVPNAAEAYDLPEATRFVKFAKLFPKPFKLYL